MVPRSLRLSLMMVCVALAGSNANSAQGIPLTVGPLTVTVPPGWTGQTNSVPVRIFAPGSTPLQFFSVEFFPPDPRPLGLAEHQQQTWQRIATTFRIISPPQSGMTGRFAWTRSDVPRAFGRKETFILYSAMAAGTCVDVAVQASTANLVTRNLPALEVMLGSAILAGDSSGPINSEPATSTMGNAPAAAGSPATLARQQASGHGRTCIYNQGSLLKRAASYGSYVVAPAAVSCTRLPSPCT